jgi:putative oxidoreductase
MKNLSAFKLDISLLVIRFILGIVVAAHGAQKLFGWFGGDGFDGTMGFFTEIIGLPYVAAFLIILIESVGMIALIAGIFSRALASALIAIMLGAIVTVHGSAGFFMNWSGTNAGEGFEFHLLAIGLSSVILINGAGVYSLDYYFGRKICESAAKKASLV